MIKITAYLQNGLEFGVSASWLSFLVIVHPKNFSSTNQLSCIWPWKPYNFRHNLNWNLRYFQAFPHDRNFLWGNGLYFWNHNTLRSLIEANIGSVIVEKFQKVISPKFGNRHKTNWSVLCSTVNYQHFTPQKSSKWFCHGYNYIFCSFKGFEPCYCSRTDCDGIGGNRNRLNIPLVP